MAGHSIITYKGKEISYIDYRGMKPDQMIETINMATSQLIKGNKPILCLTNITGTFAVPKVVEEIKKAGKKTKHLTLKSAIVGITGAKKTLLQMVNVFIGQPTKPFDDEVSAKEWLVRD